MSSVLHIDHCPPMELSGGFPYEYEGLPQSNMMNRLNIAQGFLVMPLQLFALETSSSRAKPCRFLFIVACRHTYVESRFSSASRLSEFEGNSFAIALMTQNELTYAGYECLHTEFFEYEPTLVIHALQYLQLCLESQTAVHRLATLLRKNQNILEASFPVSLQKS